jgi:hypothetical protein
MTQKHPLIRTIYLYLFTLIGLVLVTIGAIRFLDMGLKAFVFTKADDPEKIQRNYYYGLPIPVEKVSVLETSEDLTAEEIASVKSWIANYQEWQEDEAKIDYLVSRRQREASINLAMIIIGLPLYLYHWRIIRRETKNA